MKISNNFIVYMQISLIVLKMSFTACFFLSQDLIRVHELLLVVSLVFPEMQRWVFACVPLRSRALCNTTDISAETNGTLVKAQSVPGLAKDTT